MRKKLLPVLLTFALAVALLTVGALAAAPDNVIYVNANDTTADTETGVGTESNPYNSLDAAVLAAPDGSVIEILSDVTSTGFSISKDVSFRGAENDVENDKYTISFSGGIITNNCTIEFNNCDVTFYGITVGYTINAGSGTTITLNNASVVMDVQDSVSGYGARHGIYSSGSNNVLNIQNNSELTIRNYESNAITWDGTTHQINITGNSKYMSDGNRSGFTGTFNVKIENSEVEVINSTGNASNGSHFEIINSTINFNDNGNHGLSAGTLTIDHSQVTATGNGANGVHTNNTFTVKNNSVLTIQNNDCGIVSPWTLPAALHIGAGESSIDSTSTITITNNEGPGMLLKSGSLTVADGAKLTITNNEARVFNDDGVLSDGFGGGIINKGTMTLPANPDDIVIYNNHAENAGDDIYSHRHPYLRYRRHHVASRRRARLHRCH